MSDNRIQFQTDCNQNQVAYIHEMGNLPRPGDDHRRRHSRCHDLFPTHRHVADNSSCQETVANHAIMADIAIASLAAAVYPSSRAITLAFRIPPWMSSCHPKGLWGVQPGPRGLLMRARGANPAAVAPRRQHAHVPPRPATPRESRDVMDAFVSPCQFGSNKVRPPPRALLQHPQCVITPDELVF